MPSFEVCPQEVVDIAQDLLREFHQPLIDADVKISYMFAWPNLDENGSPIEDALTKGGIKCLGLTRKNPTRQRKEGLADETITLDGPYWDGAEEAERRSLLDHELQHIAVIPDGETIDGKTNYKRDNGGRPVTKHRKHDIELGWFKATAERHGVHSQEQIQAARIVEIAGQFFFPQFINANGRVGNLELDAPRQLKDFSVTVGPKEAAMLKEAAAKMRGK